MEQIAIPEGSTHYWREGNKIPIFFKFVDNTRYYFGDFGWKPSVVFDVTNEMLKPINQILIEREL